ncbi:MAG: hypothetical protein BGO69_14105 [Bacteroidetes bacterium 46-16]|nr:MAG: hypothetical protein BGO69_14105 [Bacteroidetes bacterium 46-16]
MPTVPIYTIGHSTRLQHELLELLLQYGIKYLVDIRSRPYSRYNPQYNREPFAAYLQRHNITYVYMGDLLGGHPDDIACYTDGRPDHEKIMATSFYRQGIERLTTAYEKQLAIALMCAEGKPQNCHRSRLVAPGLAVRHIPLVHIDETGTARQHEEIARLLKQADSNKNTLFSSRI